MASVPSGNYLIPREDQYSYKEVVFGPQEYESSVGKRQIKQLQSSVIRALPKQQRNQDIFLGEVLFRVQNDEWNYPSGREREVARGRGEKVHRKSLAP